jgi:hypothetical protein
MKNKFEQTLERIRKLEIELEKEFREKRALTKQYFLEQRESISKLFTLQKEYKVNLFKYILHANVKHVIIAPIIYAMIVPIVLIDATIFAYQHICFRVYQIPIVKRKDYFIIDRHHLSYLNTLEKFNCIYCGYGNAVASYVKEIIARTEQYWCPIKHNAGVKDQHSRYYKFLDYDDAEGFRKNVQHVMKDYKE